MFFLTLLAVMQLRSVSATALPALDEAVNNEIRRLEASIDFSSQQLNVKDITFLTTTTGSPFGSSWLYNAFIVYEVSENGSFERKKNS